MLRGAGCAGDVRLLQLMARTGAAWDCLDLDTCLAMLNFLTKLLQVCPPPILSTQSCYPCDGMLHPFPCPAAA